MAWGRSKDSSRAGQSRDAPAARQFAIRLLSRRDLASTELQQRLESKGFPSDVVVTTVAELLQERFLDDARYIGNYISYAAGRGQGPVRITAELKALKLPAEAIEAALDHAVDWNGLAREQRVRKFGAEAPASWPEKARQARFLQYRGFSSDHIRFALGADLDLD